MIDSGYLGPVLKWAGGKRQILAEIQEHVPHSFSAYHEPFLGGGAVLFSLRPDRAFVSDINGELMNVYQVIKDDVESLIMDLKKHRNEPKYFYRARELDRNASLYENMTPVEKASRIIFLNKTCYNGLFRVNKAGQFNTPFGHYKNPNIVNERALRAVSRFFSLADIEISCIDFEEALEKAGEGSFVYLDPPYDPVSDTASFTEYDRGGFGRNQQIRLKQACDKLDRKGARFLLSNSATDFIYRLYKGYRIEVVKARRPVNSKAHKRGEVNEVLVRNY